MEWLNEHGTTLYIRRDAEKILSRLTAYGREKRPMFRGKSDEELLAFMRAQMAEREPQYALAHLSLDCSSIGDDDAVERIVAMINSRG